MLYKIRCKETIVKLRPHYANMNLVLSLPIRKRCIIDIINDLLTCTASTRNTFVAN